MSWSMGGSGTLGPTPWTRACFLSDFLSLSTFSSPIAALTLRQKTFSFLNFHNLKKPKVVVVVQLVVVVVVATTTTITTTTSTSTSSSISSIVSCLTVIWSVYHIEYTSSAGLLRIKYFRDAPRVSFFNPLTFDFNPASARSTNLSCMIIGLVSSSCRHTEWQTRH